MFDGTYTALVTPFAGAEVDLDAFGKLIDVQVAAGVNGVVPCGSTGESATLSHREHERLIAFAVERVAGRVKVIAGTGSNSTAETIALTRFAKEHGADGALLIAPYYNKPTQDGLEAHFRAVADNVALPQMLYNIPGRSVVNIEPETIARLAQVPNIVGIKEASGSLDQVSRIVQSCPQEFCVLSGDDTLTLPIMSVGGRGVIAVIANLLPTQLCAMVNAGLAGDFVAARKTHFEMLPLMHAMGFETNPIPVKTALGLLGQVDPTLRLPLTAMREDSSARLRLCLQAAKLL